MPIYQIIPQDILFFRDGRPMEANVGSGGHGAHWPAPSLMFDALHAALHRAFPQPELDQNNQVLWEHAHRYGRSSNRDYTRNPSQRFGSLATFGPFPAEFGEDGSAEWFFPAPADVTHDNFLRPTFLPMREPQGTSNLPPLLQDHPLGAKAPPSKETAKPWWNKLAVERYLGIEPAVGLVPHCENDDHFFIREWATGNAIDPATQVAGQGEAEGKLYSAEYLRFRDQVKIDNRKVHMGMALHAQMPLIGRNGHDPEEGLRRLFPANEIILCGGQQRACRVEEMGTTDLATRLPLSAPVTGQLVKWVLLTPALFPAIEAKEIAGADGKTRRISAHSGGWLPNWIAPEDGYRVLQGDKEVEVSKGRVLLKFASEPGNGKRREDRRKKVREADFLDCHLVAARIPKPIVVTGWSERLHLATDDYETEAWLKAKGPRSTWLAVAAGAVYYFAGPDAPALARALAWHGEAQQGEHVSSPRNRRSTLMGEKGFGLGGGGPWQYFEDAPSPSAYSENS